jgi:hypothetical protein
VAVCRECGKNVEQGKELCLPCSLEEQVGDVDIDENFERFKKEKPKWK